jgi:hypothetical protein
MEHQLYNLIARPTYPAAETPLKERDQFARLAFSYYLDAMYPADRAYAKYVLEQEAFDRPVEPNFRIDRREVNRILTQSADYTERKLSFTGISREDYHNVYHAFQRGDWQYLERKKRQSMEYIANVPPLVSTWETHQKDPERHEKFIRQIVSDMVDHVPASDSPKCRFIAGNLGSGKSVVTGLYDPYTHVMIDPDKVRPLLFDGYEEACDENNQFHIMAAQKELQIVLDRVFEAAVEGGKSIVCETSLRSLSPWWANVFQTLPDLGWYMDLTYVLRPASDCVRRMVTHRSRVAPLKEVIEGSRGGQHFYNIVMDLYDRNIAHEAHIVDFSDAVEGHSGVLCRTGADIHDLLTIQLLQDNPNVSVTARPDDIPIE